MKSTAGRLHRPASSSAHHGSRGLRQDSQCRCKGDRWRKGDRVVFDSTISCGQCLSCRDGQVNLGENHRVVGVAPAEDRQHEACLLRSWLSRPGSYTRCPKTYLV